jgi:radial spoke head protein 9
VRSLLYPGYHFYYSAHDLTWGGLYSGDGLRNDDLIFML